jgi:hypothetical protein
MTETSGAWIWPIPITSCAAHGGRSVKVFVVDTEGLGSGPRSRDKALLMAMSVASSVMVYHMSEFVYRDDIAMLHGLARLLWHYRDRGILNEVGVPSLAWVVQRFELKFSGTPEGVLLDTWMAEISNPHDNEEISRFNFTAKFVKDAFPLSGVFLVHGARAWGSKPSDCPQEVPISSLPPKCLDASYVAEISRLKEMLACSKPRTRRAIDTGVSVPITGAEIVEAMEAAVTMLEDDIALSSDAVADAILLSRLRDISSNMTDFVRNISYPMDSVAITSLVDERKEELQGLVASVSLAYLASHTSRERAESELASIISKGETLAHELNAKASEEVCSAAEMEALYYIHNATGLVSGKHRSSMGVPQFDAIMSVCLSHYMSKAVGPAAESHYDSLKGKLEAERGEVERMEGPKKKGIWVAGAFIAFATTRSLAALSRTCVPLSALFSLLEVMSLCVAMISAWSIVGDPPIEFDRMTGIILGILSARTLKAIICCLAVASGALLAIAMVRKRRRNRMLWTNPSVPVIVRSVEVNNITHRSEVMNAAKITAESCLAETVVVIAITPFDSTCVVWVAGPSCVSQGCIILATAAHLKLTDDTCMRTARYRTAAGSSPMTSTNSKQVVTETKYIKEGCVCVVNTNAFASTVSREEIRFASDGQLGEYLKNLKF